MDAGLLWARASIVGGLAFTFGLLGHVTADGLLPGAWLLGLLLAMSVLLCAPMLSRPAGRLRMVLTLVAGQAGTHLFLTLSAGHAGDPVHHAASTPRPDLSGSPQLPVVDGPRVGSLLDAYRTMTDSTHAATPVLPVGHLISDLSAHAPMMGVHLVAAALVGLWLAHGERCLWTLVALTGHHLFVAVALVTPVALPAARMQRVADREPAAARHLWRVRPHGVRGPPLLVV